MGDLGVVRLILKPEWAGAASAAFASAVASASSQSSSIYRLEPGFLIQGRLGAQGVKPSTLKPRAPKVMERGEVGWAGGSAGPDFFIYLGSGPATWLGNPHDGTVWAEVADEASMAVAANVSMLAVRPTKPGEMHLLAKNLNVRVAAWEPPEPSLAGPPALGILKVASTSFDAAARACEPSCHALQHTELHGDVVKWGSEHLLESAALCCAACAAHAAAAAAKPDGQQRGCNAWVYCSNGPLCGKSHRQCWLKHAKSLWSNEALLVGTSDRWTSGTAEPAPPAHPSGAGRVTPSVATSDAQLEVEASEALLRRMAALGAGTPAADGLGGRRRLALRLRLREGAARVTARLRATMDGAASGRVAACGGEGAAACASLRGGATVPETWGYELAPDGLEPGQRWPRGRAAVWGTIGPLPEGASAEVAPAAWPTGNGPSSEPLEAHSTPVTRGALVWAAAGDGPAFFVALADMPQLGVSYTVWGHVAAEDLAALDALAAAVEDGTQPVPTGLQLVNRRA